MIVIKYSILLSFMAMLIDKANGAIKCYECTVIPQRRSNETVEKLCSKFEENDFFEVNCPYSTMCKKRTYRLKLQSGEWQETTERGCADQRYDYMNYIGNKWVKEYSVEEPYSEGCLKDLRDNSEYCHCRGNLCNAAGKIQPNSNIVASSGIDAMNVLIVFNLVKYFRNMDYL